MQTTAIAVFALIFAQGAALSRTGETAAIEWLRRHKAPQADELDELKSENPEAFAIVKALLTKRSLGLLDPKHPSASFTKASTNDAEETGVAAFAKLATPGELKGVPEGMAMEKKSSPASQEDDIEVPQRPAHHDWLSWKPANSAMDDDAMVKNVLSAVADLKGAKSPAKSSNASPLEAEESLFNDDASAQAPAQAAVVSKHSTEATATVTEETPAVAERKPATMKLAETSEKSGNFLASFSWGDDAPKQSQEESQPSKAEQAAPPAKKNALLSWLNR